MALFKKSTAKSKAKASTKKEDSQSPTAEHAERLGSAANTSSDIGYMLGTVEPRKNWPA
jgi:hypothetical protein|tara:strand:- start:3030 stop:3206 length:177 start_codon:yes stop_codon:yes gene_type:complete